MLENDLSEKIINNYSEDLLSALASNRSYIIANARPADLLHFNGKHEFREITIPKVDFYVKYQHYLESHNNVSGEISNELTYTPYINDEEPIFAKSIGKTTLNDPPLNIHSEILDRLVRKLIKDREYSDILQIYIEKDSGVKHINSLCKKLHLDINDSLYRLRKVFTIQRKKSDFKSLWCHICFLFNCEVHKTESGIVRIDMSHWTGGSRKKK